MKHIKKHITAACLFSIILIFQALVFLSINRTCEMGGLSVFEYIGLSILQFANLLGMAGIAIVLWALYKD